MIIPTIGRVVWVYRNGSRPPNQAEPALVSFVTNDRLINVAGFDMYGNHFSAIGLTLLQEEDNPALFTGSYACWMPYQQAAARKYPA